LGIATHYVKQENLSDLVNELKNVQDPTLPRLVSLITPFSAPSPSESSTWSSKSNPDAPSPLTGSVRALIDHAFSQPTVTKIYEALRSAIKDEEAKWDDRAKEWAAKQIEIMDTRSPTGMKVALINYRKARKMRDLKGQFNDDLAMCTAFLVSTSLSKRALGDCRS
jgi:3-hydroxyisobutyryl-CoA hydrolase